MKKRKIVSIALIVALCAIVVSGTLAYFTDKTDNVTNKFETKRLSIQLWEYDAEQDEDTLEWSATDEKLYASKTGDETTAEAVGVDYTDILPGMVLPKNPTVTVEKDSVDCWIFVKVTTEVKTAKALFDAVNGADGSSADLTPENAYAVVDALLGDTYDEKWELPEEGFFKVENGMVSFVIGYNEVVPSSTADQDFPIFTEIDVPAAWGNAEMQALNEATLTFQAFAIQAYKFPTMQDALDELAILD